GDMGLTTRHEFKALIEVARPNIVQPDVGWVGGLTEMGEIAALARAAGVRLVPHGYRSNVLLATNLAILAAAPDDEWLEYSVSESPIRWIVTKERLSIGPDGRVGVPQGPGLGVTLDEDAIAPYRYL
ncbi:MAG: mandelate racemase/muconate lactonizing enzyme family protein, partial [Alphaproteobacteria bacterium]|nr:mandelate racemase/muconate lactonizing enzyme family protein [Alphaproteobacteria bacterium]